MTRKTPIEDVVSLLQDLGLKEYEARCFVALTQLSDGTAKEIHELSGVPRTRVYDAIRVLESQGLVDVQHSSPQVYRAVGITEATRTLRREYDDRIERLESRLDEIDVRDLEADDELQAVWSLNGHAAIESRMLQLIDDAESEIVLLVVDEEILSAPLFEAVHEAATRELSILLGGETESITATLGTELPNLRVFETGLDWLTGSQIDHEVAISRILLVDRETLLIGTYYPDAADGKAKEGAIFATGLENGVIVLLRRLISSGLPPTNDPGKQRS